MKNRRWNPTEARVRRWWHARKDDPRTMATVEALVVLGGLPLAYVAVCAFLAL